VNEIQSGQSVYRNAVMGDINGYTLPPINEIQITGLTSDDNHLRCFFFNALGVKVLKLAYLIKEQEQTQDQQTEQQPEQQQEEQPQDQGQEQQTTITE